MKFTRVAAAAVAALVVAAGAASPGAAETLSRNGVSKVAIKPAGAPANSVVVKARVTVKKGKKTVARNKSSYRAKKGTYRVTSTYTFRPKVVAKVASADVFAQCRVATRAIVSDRTQPTAWHDGSVYYSGQVTVRYTGTCIDRLYLAGNSRDVTWSTAWTDDDYLLTKNVYLGGDPLAAKLADVYYTIGDRAYVAGADMATLPTYTTLASKRTTKNTRTVVVR